MLDAGADPLGLDTVDEGRGQLAAEQRILGEILEVPPAQGVAFDVHPGAEQHGHPFRHALLAESDADLLQQLTVP